MRRDLASAPERRVIILGPEGPSFRCCENRIPVSGRQAGSISQAIPGSAPPLGYRAALVGGALRVPWKVETHLDLGIAV
jgi:hypothetical protein